MIPMGSNSDEWIASVASFVRTSFGNTAAPVSPGDVTRVRLATAARKSSWTVTEIESALPVLLQAAPGWKATASVASERATAALAGSGSWTSGGPQQSGIWFQIELPEPAAITEVQIDAPAPPFGGRGRRGAAPAAQPPVAAGGTRPAPTAGGATPAAAAPAVTTPPAPPADSLGYPRGYSVQLSTDGAVWGAPVAQGQGAGPTTVIAFPPARAKFIRITQTASGDAPPWTIQRVRVYQPPPGGTR
jgi:hypothetical protein